MQAKQATRVTPPRPNTIIDANPRYNISFAL